MVSVVYDRYIADAASWARTVEFWRTVLYCYVMCRRLEPAYVEFHEREKWGSPQLLTEAQRVVRSWLASADLDEASANDLLVRIEPNVPHTEDFDCSEAVDAISVHAYSIGAILSQSLTHVAHVYTIAYDRADAAASDALLPTGGFYTPKIEAAIERHAYVQEEISWQRRMFASLRSGPNRDEVSITRWLSSVPQAPRYGPCR